jgi:Zn-dependent protease with chaperone function
MRRSEGPGSLVRWTFAFWAKWSLLLLFLFLLVQPRTLAQNTSSASSQQSAEDDESDAPWTSIRIELDDRSPALVFVTSSDDASAPTDISHKYDFLQTIGEMLGCKPKRLPRSDRPSEATDFLRAQCDVPLTKSIISRRGTLNLESIKKIQSAEPDREIFVELYVSDSNMLDCGSPKASPNKLKSYCSYFVRTTEPPVVRFEYGYPRSQALLIVGVLASLLAIPIALTFFFRRRAQNLPLEKRPSISFAHRRFVIQTTLWGLLIWWAALDILHVDTFAGFVIPFPHFGDSFASSVLLWFSLWIPAIVVYFLCLLLSSPMLGLRGTTRTGKEALDQSFWSVARIVFPAVFAGVGVGELFYSPRIGVVLIVVGIVVTKITSRNFVRAYGIELHALTSGELRDRAFAIARAAGVSLNQLYVLPAERMRMANAFAHAAKNVYLTDYLVQNLDKPEVDAIIGHEIAHLEKKHVSRRTAFTVLGIIGFGFASGLVSVWIPQSVPKGPIFYAILLLILLIVSRRNEFAADAEGAKLSGSAEAMITALTRITRLNTMPLQWSKLDEKLLTHPSTLRRIKRLAHASGISDVRVSELLTQSMAPPHEIYSIPATALPAGKIFSTQYKKRIAVRLAWAIIAIGSFMPAITVSIVHSLGLQGGVLWLAYSVGFLLTVVTILAVTNFLSMQGTRTLEESLRKKLGSSGVQSGGTRGIFVGLSPDSVPRIYEWNWSWDVGLLQLQGDQLRYRGEEATFALTRSEITSIELGPGPVGWFRAQSIYISWRDSAANIGTFNLRCLSTGSLQEMGTRTRSLAADLQSWQKGLPVSDHTLFSQATHEPILRPVFGQVTSASPRFAVQRQLLYVEFFLNTVVAVGVILLFGISFPLISSLSQRDSPVDLNTDYGAIYVLSVVWAVRIFVLIPYWRSPKQPEARTASVGAAVPGARSNIQML